MIFRSWPGALTGVLCSNGRNRITQRTGRGGLKVWKVADRKPYSYARADYFPLLIIQNQHQMACSPLTARDAGLFDSFEHTANDAGKTAFKASNGKGFRLILILLNNQQQMAVNQQQIKKGKSPLPRNT